MRSNCKPLVSLGYWLVLVMTGGNLFSQKSNSIEVRDLNNDLLPFAWAGGLNAPQFSEIDLNNDSIPDLFIFDRDGNRVLTFINNGSSGQIDYTYAPEYEDKFPPMTDWALLVDYNNDGKHDIFTYNSGGIKVYKNTSSSGNLTFALEVFPYLTSNSGNGFPPSNIYVSRIDIPAIIDVDFDGDIDVLSFSVNSNQITFYENFALDSGNIEAFKFHDNTYCWGNFREDALTNKVILNQSCPKIKLKAKGNKHGGASILGFDPDGDQDIDIVLGDPTFTNLVFLENGGSSTYANIVSQDTAFPSYNTGVDLSIFPAAFHFDVNNDGLKDFIVSPNTIFASENYKGVLYYENIGTATKANFSFRMNDFIQGSMIDLGSYAYPALFDYNFDGLPDLIVGNGGYYNGTNSSIHKLALFENTGTSTDPKFKMIDDDYADISRYNLNTGVNKPTFHIVPAFGDMNSDGSVDMLIGDFQGRLHYFQNEPKAGISDFVFIEADYRSIDVGSYASPFLIDLDGDGLIDIVSGKQNGRLNYYKNTGTSDNPYYNSIPDNTKLGGVNTTPWNDYDGFSQPKFFRTNHELYMVSGAKGGTIFKYGNIENNIGGSFSFLDSLLLNIDVGDRSHVSISDLNSDGKFEIIIGNSGGGLSFYLTDELVGIKENQSNQNSEWNFTIKKLSNQQALLVPSQPGKGQIRLYSITGREIFSDQFNGAYLLEITPYSNGVYLISLEMKEQIKTQKIILTK